MTKSIWARLERWAEPLLYALIAIDVVVGVILRFWTTSKLWLDEAQSVNIAAKPLSELPHYLRLDGAPPLYYAILHGWMGIVGGSDFQVRALSGLFSVLGMVAVYFAMRAWFNRLNGLLALAVVAVLPYCVYFGTEVRMYSLVMLESALLMLVLRWHLDKPRWLTTVGITLLMTSLLYTHYWALYLVAMLGIFAVTRWYLHRKEAGHQHVLMVGAVATSVILWLPWFPIFNEQRLHTATPWAIAPTLYQLFTWFDGFTVNQSVPHVVASLHTQVTIMVFVALVLMGIFAYPMTRDKILMTLDPRGISNTRTIAYLVLATMAIGLVASNVSGSAYVPRYAAVIAIPICFLAARGLSNFTTMLRILLVLGLFSASTLWTDKWGITTQRSQAGVVSAALAFVPRGSVVLVCPDQLGPSLLRYSNPDLNYVGYPRLEDPSIVNWYDYLDAYKIRTPAENAAIVARNIAPNQRVFVVRAHNYGIKLTCWNFTAYLAADLHRTMTTVVSGHIGGYYQYMEMQELRTPAR